MERRLLGPESDLDVLADRAVQYVMSRQAGRGRDSKSKGERSVSLRRTERERKQEETRQRNKERNKDRGKKSRNKERNKENRLRT